jgi:transposase InsO family protein
MPRPSPDEPALIARIVALATRFGRYGYRRITALLRAEGWRVNHKRVERLWRQEGLNVAAAQEVGWTAHRFKGDYEALQADLRAHGYDW